jgi:hypothetical protein
MTLRLPPALAAALTLATAGCGPTIDVVKTFRLPDQGSVAYMLVLLPQSRDQTVTAAVEVTGDPVDVFVMNNADVPPEFDTTDAEKQRLEAKAYGSARGVTSGKVTCKVPAKVEARVVIVLSGKKGTKTEGTLKVTG